MADIKQAIEIINETNDLIKKTQNSILLLNEKCLKYVSEVDTYNKNYVYDASILKKRMADAVRKAVPDDI